MVVSGTIEVQAIQCGEALRFHRCRLASVGRTQTPNDVPEKRGIKLTLMRGLPQKCPLTGGKISVRFLPFCNTDRRLLMLFHDTAIDGPGRRTHQEYRLT